MKHLTGIFFKNQKEKLFCTATSTGYFEELNDAWTLKLGWTIEELTKTPFINFVHPENLEGTKLMVVKLFKDKEIVGYVNRFRCKNEKYIWLSWTITYDEELKLFFGTADEVNEQVNLKRELGVIQQIMDETAIISITDVNGKIVEVNKNLEKISGYEAKELIGQNHRLIKSGLHPKSFYEEMWKTVSAGKTWRGELCNRKKSGDIYWVDSTIIPIFDEHKKITNYFSFRYDITEKKKVEQTLINQKKKFHSIFENSNDAITIFSIQRGFVDCNQKALLLFGFDSKEELEASHPHKLSPEYQMDGTSSLIRSREFLEIAIKNNNARFEWLHLRKNGAEFFAEVSLSSFEYDGEQLIQGTMRDITEKKSTEAKLQQAAKMASLGEMAGGIAHEINNPLSIISASSELLITDIEEQEMSKQDLIARVQVIQDVSDRIAKIIKGLKVFSRNSEIDPLSCVSLYSLLETTKTLSSQKFKNGKVRLEFCKPEEDILINCRETQIAQVLINLLNNAYDSVCEMKESWVQLKVDANVAQNCLKLSVVDSGSKIPAHIASKLMEPFFTTKGVGQGTGLGLSISRKIMETHQGRFWLDQEAEHPTFIVEMPIQQLSKS